MGYKLIYDYIGEESYDTCRGITEKYDTFAEAQQAMSDLKQNPNYCNFSIVDAEF